MIVHLALLVILLVLNIIPETWINRKRYILPFSFLLVLVYWAIRYDYGLDYWNYFELFYTDIGNNRTGFGELWFYNFIHFFKYYYQCIIAQSIIIVISLYHLVHKHISSKWYWLFFLLLFIVPDFHFNLISAQRSTMAACVLYWAFDLFYLQRKRWLLFVGMVFLASMFHTSSLVFLAIPLFYLLFSKLSGRAVFIILLVSNILSVFISNFLFDYIVKGFEFFNDYDTYVDKVTNRSLTSMLGGFFVLIPCWFICGNYRKGDRAYDSACILAFLFQVLDFIHLNFQGRFSVYLYPFFIIALSAMLEKLNRQTRWITLIPYFFALGYSLYWYYWTLYSKINLEYSSGNMFYYHTIFEAPSLP